MPAVNQKPDFVVICCRPARTNWLLVFMPGFYGSMAAMVSHAPTPRGLPSPTETIVWESISALCLIGALGIAWWLLRACVIGDSDGLRGRGLGGWKSARWDEVSDYYEKLPTRMQRSSGVRNSSGTHLPAIVSIIETPVGKFGVTSLWSHADALREQVEQWAIHCRASGWELKGTRAVDPWPRRFDYNTLENRWAPRLWLKLFLAFVVYLLIQPALQLTVMAGLVGWTVTLITAGFYLLLIGSVGLIFLIPFAQYRAAGQRKSERITVDSNGIMFEEEARRLEAAWSDVTGYGTSSGQNIAVCYVVETRLGKFSFLPNIGNAELLKAIIQCLATDAADHDWHSRVSPEALGGEAARWSGGEIGVGARVYHYRTRMNRALLWLPLMLCFVFGLMAALAGQGLLPGSSLLALILSGAGSGLGLILGYLTYRICRIESDEKGLTQTTLVGKRRMHWEQIENYYLTKEQGGMIVGRAAHIQFSAQIVGREELKAEIAQRATNCGGKAWECLLTTPVPSDLRRGKTELK